MKQLCVRVIALILIITSVQFGTAEVSAKSVSRIVIPMTYAKQDSGHARILKLDVVYSDGSIERITKGVTWSSTTKKVARVGKETVVAGVPGKTTLTAT